MIEGQGFTTLNAMFLYAIGSRYSVRRQQKYVDIIFKGPINKKKIWGEILLIG